MMLRNNTKVIRTIYCGLITDLGLIKRIKKGGCPSFLVEQISNYLSFSKKQILTKQYRYDIIIA